MHARTVGPGAAFAAWRDRLPEAAGLERLNEDHHYHQRLIRLWEWFRAADIALGDGCGHAVAQCAAHAVSARDFCCLTHGDVAPTNAVIAADGAAVLLDFEYAGYRHALVDALTWHLVCPLPEPLAEACDLAYRSELVNGISAAADDARWREERARIATWRGLDVLSWLPIAALDEDVPWVDDWTARSALLCIAGRLAALAALSETTAPVADAVLRLRDRLALRWPTTRAGPPEWPGFSAQP